MASENKKHSPLLLTPIALLLAAAIPAGSWIWGQYAANAEEEALLEQRKTAERFWKAKDTAVGEADLQSAVEKELADYHLAALSAIEQTIPGIVCWGDSITAGVNGGGDTYPGTLQSLLQTELNTAFRRLYPADFKTDQKYNMPIPVVNMGVVGESSLTVAGRNGAVPYVLTEDVTIPAEAESFVRIRFTSETGEAVEPLVRGSRGLGMVTLAGVEGVMEIRPTYREEVRYAYYFARSEEGEEVTVSAGTPIGTAGQVYKDYLAVIQLGHNGGWRDADDLIAQINAIIAAQTDPERYIVLGLTFGDAEVLAEVNGALAAAYGEHFIDLWQYMREEGLADAGIEPSQEDIEVMEEGFLPDSFTDGANTFNSAGYKAVAGCIQQKIHELGYLDAVNAVLSDEIESDPSAENE